jgi:hypothetical protein
VFSRGEAPLTLGLVVDRSQSMPAKTPAVLAAVGALARASRPGDEMFAVTFNDRVALARQSDVVIYAIGLLSTSPAEEEENAWLLGRLCGDTGGVAYFPETASEMVTMSIKVAGDLRDQYTLGFTPSERTGARVLRTIRVTVTAPGRGRLHVRTRSGTLPRQRCPVNPGTSCWRATATRSSGLSRACRLATRSR